MRLVAAPGAQHLYSSPNYQGLGRVVERGVVGPVVPAVEGSPAGPSLRRLVRLGWHLTSLAWVGLAAALASSSGSGVQWAGAAVAAISRQWVRRS